MKKSCVGYFTGTRIPDPPFFSFGPSRDYGNMLGSIFSYKHFLALPVASLCLFGMHGLYKNLSLWVAINSLI
jgi:hypothetical protein